MTVRFTRSLGAWLTVMLLGTSFCPLGISASPAVSAEEAAAGDKTATNLVDTAEATLNSDKEMNEARETDAPLMPVNSKPGRYRRKSDFCLRGPGEDNQRLHQYHL